MKKAIILSLHTLFAFIIIGIFPFLLRAQETGVRIKEKVVINPAQTLTKPSQTNDLQPSITLTMPFDGVATVALCAGYMLVSDTTSLTMNGQLIFHIIPEHPQGGDIRLGEFKQGESLTFVLSHAEGWPYYGTPWLGEAQEAQGVWKPDCYDGYGLSYSENYFGYCYIDLDVGF